MARISLHWSTRRLSQRHIAENKKEHYVPRFLLKRFSKDDRSINPYNIKSQRTITGANLKNPVLLGLSIPARTGHKDAEVRAEMLDALAAWIESVG